MKLTVWSYVVYFLLLLRLRFSTGSNHFTQKTSIDLYSLRLFMIEFSRRKIVLFKVFTKQVKFALFIHIMKHILSQDGYLFTSNYLSEQKTSKLCYALAIIKMYFTRNIRFCLACCWEDYFTQFSKWMRLGFFY